MKKGSSNKHRMEIRRESSACSKKYTEFTEKAANDHQSLETQGSGADTGPRRLSTISINE